MILRLLGEHPAIDPEDVRAALKTLDSSEYGGAPLLGVRGVSIICHGNSSPRAIKNAVKMAVRAVETRMTDQIGIRLEEAAPAIEAAARSA
jgi:glycerol-3-phosphate acyltransferase PlsX